jgi:hypothetical protein
MLLNGARAVFVRLTWMPCSRQYSYKSIMSAQVS